MKSIGVGRRALIALAVGTVTVLHTAPPSPGLACFDRPGPLIALGGVRTRPYSNTALDDYTRVDGSSAQFLTGRNLPLVLGGGSGSCFRGGEILGQWPPATGWAAMHNAYALRVKDIPDFAVEDARAFDFGDGASLETVSSRWTMRRVHFKYMRDDCVQNDGLNSGVIDSSLFEGCYVGLSARSLNKAKVGSDNLLVVQNSLFWLQDMDQGYPGPGHGGHGAFFKWSAHGPKVSLFNNVFRVDGRSRLGNQTLGPPKGKLADCANNVMIWLGAGPFPETLPGCYMLLTGTVGLDYWNSAVAEWMAAHPDPLPDVAAPILSLYWPQAGATLVGTVRLTATAVDDRTVVAVQFRLNGTNIGPEITSDSPPSRFTVSWDSHAVPSGTYSLSALARDAAGHAAIAQAISVTVDNRTSQTHDSASRRSRCPEERSDASC